MQTMTITLPEEIKAFLEEQAVREGATVSEYLGSMLRLARERARGRHEVREKLLEALESGPATPMTREDWEDIRRQVHARHQSGRGRADAQPAG